MYRGFVLAAAAPGSSFAARHSPQKNICTEVIHNQGCGLFDWQVPTSCLLSFTSRPDCGVDVGRICKHQTNNFACCRKTHKRRGWTIVCVSDQWKTADGSCSCRALEETAVSRAQSFWKNKPPDSWTAQSLFFKLYRLKKWIYLHSCC